MNNPQCTDQSDWTVVPCGRGIAGFGLIHNTLFNLIKDAFRMNPPQSLGPPKALVLLSGGLDSSTVLAMALAEGYDVTALSFEYSQRHAIELSYAEQQARIANVPHQIIGIGILAGAAGSALTDLKQAIPKASSTNEVPTEIPVSYVPGRNILFLAYAVGYAEVLGAQHIFCGVNALDYSGYPDCRPEFISAFEQAVNLGTKNGTEGLPFTIHTPLIEMTKAEIITAGTLLGVTYARTWSCYDPDHALGPAQPCRICDSCALRAKGFAEAGLEDPALA